MKLNEAQRAVATHYEGGEYAHVESFHEVKLFGDDFFAFLMAEAGDAEDLDEFHSMLGIVRDQLEQLDSKIRVDLCT